MDVNSERLIVDALNNLLASDDPAVMREAHEALANPAVRLYLKKINERCDVEVLQLSRELLTTGYDMERCAGQVDAIRGHMLVAEFISALLRVHVLSQTDELGGPRALADRALNVTEDSESEGYDVW